MKSSEAGAAIIEEGAGRSRCPVGRCFEAVSLPVDQKCRRSLLQDQRRKRTSKVSLRRRLEAGFKVPWPRTRSTSGRIKWPTI